MSIEQWGVLALFVLLPLLEGLTRFRRAHAGNGQASDGLGEVRTSQHRTSQPGLSLPAPPSPPAIAPAGLPASLAPSRTGSASVKARTGIGKSGAGDAVGQWLRPARNLRRAIIVATILGPPTQ
jgi:hypothetical protein